MIEAIVVELRDTARVCNNQEQELVVRVRDGGRAVWPRDLEGSTC
ncbi:MAG TPA: hypothetical protein VKF14_03455 [Candidatus Dormibacteraeota bacterium]|nr:hypothetical protein [Candidatus Dormibacteraeota bacterium]